MIEKKIGGQGYKYNEARKFKEDPTSYYDKK
jgi:hypothetical protein